MEFKKEEELTISNRLSRGGRWPREHGRKVVEAWERSGLTLEGFAVTAGVPKHKLQYWREQMKRRTASVSLLPVVVRSEARASQTMSLKACGQAASIDPEWAAAFVRALFSGEAAR